MKVALSFAMAAFLVSSASGAVKVDHEVGVDFTGYKTYAWRQGTEAARPQVQQWIVAAVEREDLGPEAAGERHLGGGHQQVVVPRVTLQGSGQHRQGLLPPLQALQGEGLDIGVAGQLRRQFGGPRQRNQGFIQALFPNQQQAKGMGQAGVVRGQLHALAQQAFALATVRLARIKSLNVN